ncbi:MAG: DUF1735 domain-containing protein [Dysgonamonadaceae bacterium]|jgi:hypothetical protein|nr:DUF1735 domain-containing protein [Dysgonamonadaceae bacterium]
MRQNMIFRKSPTSLRLKLICLSAILLVSCGFEDVEDTYSYTSVLFPYGAYNRNLIVGEGLKLDVGIIFSGVLNNKQDRNIQYVIDPSLVTGEQKTVLPSTFYTCKHPSLIVVPKGELKGYLPVALDSVAFLNDPKSLTGEYILPLRLVSSSDVDSIDPGLNSICISISYYARQHGYYTYSGKINKTKGGSVLNDGAYANNPSVTDSRRFLKTVGYNKFCVTADETNNSDPAKGVYTFFMEVPVNGGGAVTISADPNSPVKVYPDGESTYDADNKTFRLSYTYTSNDGTVCKISETLVFRNRIRDVQDNGLYINEWR